MKVTHPVAAAPSWTWAWVGRTFAAAFWAVVLAYAVVLPFGWWERNVLAWGANGLAATILTGALLVADRSRRPAVFHGVAGFVVAAAYFAMMAAMLPPTAWLAWWPVYAYLVLVWWLGYVLSRTLHAAAE